MFNELAVSNEGSGDDATSTAPDELAGSYLELPGVSGQSFTFTRADSFIQIDNIPTFQLRSAFYFYNILPLIIMYYIRETPPREMNISFRHKTHAGPIWWR
jgi:hypothetical protein